MKPQEQQRECPVCGSKTGKECGRVECANRKRITAQMPDESLKNGWHGGGTHRRAPIDED